MALQVCDHPHFRRLLSAAGTAPALMAQDAPTSPAAAQPGHPHHASTPTPLQQELSNTHACPAASANEYGRRYAGGSVHSFLKHLFSSLAPPNGLPRAPGSMGDQQRAALQKLLEPRAPGMLRSLAAGVVGALPSSALDQICGAVFAILQVRPAPACASVCSTVVSATPHMWLETSMGLAKLIQDDRAWLNEP